MERLDRLGTILAQGGDLRPFYFELSEAIRDYLGGRFGFDSLEMTTEELVAAMRRVPADETRGVLGSEIEGLALGLRPGQVRQGLARRWSKRAARSRPRFAWSRPPARARNAPPQSPVPEVARA